MHTRAHIRFNTTNEAAQFINELTAAKLNEKFVFEDFNTEIKVSASSILGVIYMMTDFRDKMYLVNETIDGHFPFFVDKYRI